MPLLRIGFLAHEWTRVEPWAHRLISQIEENENFNIVALIEGQDEINRTSTNWLCKLIYPVEQYFCARAIPADTTKISEILARHSSFNLTNIDNISDLELDVIICVDAGLATPELAFLARHGIWFLDIFDQANGLTAFAAVCGREPSACIKLNRFIAAQEEAQNIGSARINPKYLLSRNLLFMKEKSVVLISRELRRLSRVGNVAVQKDSLDQAKPDPQTLDMLRYIQKAISHIARKGMRRLKRKTGIRPDKFILLTGKGDALTFDPSASTKIVPNGKSFWADPFLWIRDGKTYCFYEHYCYDTKLGHIQVGVFSDDKMTVLGDALKADTHFSFPFLFEHEGDLFMMPETWATNRIEIWKCHDFPLKWKLHSTALEGNNVADSMILRRDNKWWLFTNIATDIHSDNCSELHIFEVDGPDLNHVTPHTENPVSLDSRTARNAGRFHEIDGRLFRPSQDNSYSQYGYGLNIMEVHELTLQSYTESLVRKIEPNFDQNFIGCHHFDAKGERFIIDALQVR